jgi:hypothetical protein
MNTLVHVAHARTTAWALRSTAKTAAASFACTSAEQVLHAELYDPLGGSYRRVRAALGDDAALAWARAEVVGAVAMVGEDRRGHVVQLRPLPNATVPALVCRGGAHRGREGER